MDVYVLQRVIIHDGTYVEGVTLDVEIARAWEDQSPFIVGVDQQEWNVYSRFTPEEDILDGELTYED